MKRILLSLSFIICHLTFNSVAAQTTPAFPGAEGHGRYVTGGRGGKVVHVTNLNDSGTGSFRSAVSGSSKKIVVFDVGGVIALKSNVNIGANTTIMGQTAPAPGITLRYYSVNPNGNNIVMRFIRIRRGQEKDVNDGADASTARHYTGMMLDHCSLSWSIDEVASFYDNNNFTMQWCTIGESLCNAGHGKGAHGYGGIWGGKLASFHHNLILHVANRSPRFNGARYDWTGYTGNQLYSQYNWQNAVQAENVDFRNCVVYNTNGCYGGPGGGKVNMVGNYYKSGPGATIDRLTTVTVGASGNSEGYPKYWGMTSRYFVDGNMIDNRNAGWETFRFDDGTIERNGRRYSKDPNHYNGASEEYITVGGTDYICMKLDEAGPMGDVTTHTAAKAYQQVLAYAGASLCRDDVDQRYASETLNGTCTYKGSVTNQWGRIDKVSDVNGYTETNFGTGSRPADFDTDKDGMPDAWEAANGLDPTKNDANLYTLDSQHQYYTNIEVYCNSLVQDIMLNENGEALQDQAVNDYFPAYRNEDASLVAAVNEPMQQGEEDQDMSFTLSAETNTGENTTSVWNFMNGYTITNTRSKSYTTGNNSGIKYSAGVQYTINLPENVSVNKATFTGYDNYTDADAYLGEVAGVTYEATQYVFPKSKETVTHTIDVIPAVSDNLTFTPQVKQLVLSITLSGKKETTAIEEKMTSAHERASLFYNMQGQRVDAHTRGLVIETIVMPDGTRQSRTVLRR